MSLRSAINKNIHNLRYSRLKLPFRANYSNPGLLLLIVLGVLALSGVLALKASQDQLLMVLGAILGTGFIVVLMRWPQIGFPAIVVTGFTLPNLSRGINPAMGIAALILVLWIADGLVRRREFSILTSHITLPLLAFVVVGVISFGVGQMPWFSFTQNAPMDAQLGGLAILVLSVGVLILVADQIRDIRWLQILTWTFLVFGAITLLGQVIPFTAVVTRKIIQAKTTGGMFFAWLPAMAFSQAVFNNQLHKGWRIALVLLFLAALYYGVGLRFDWKSGWVPTLVALFVIIGARQWRLGLAIALLGMIPLWLLSGQVLATDEYSVSTRLEAWIILSEIIKVNPLLGLGFANYYFYTPLFSIRGWNVNFNSHNNYVDIVAQTGLIGVFCFLWFFWQIGKLAWDLRTRVPDGFARAYIFGAFGGVVGTVIAAGLGDWVLPFVYNIGFDGLRMGLVGWMLLGGILALSKMYAGSPNSSPL